MVPTDEALQVASDAENEAVEIVARQQLHGRPAMTTAASCALALGQILGGEAEDAAHFEQGLAILFSLANTSGRARLRGKTH
jgi:hypothetical protein